jgi:3-dehydroquinate synthase
MAEVSKCGFIADTQKKAVADSIDLKDPISDTQALFDLVSRAVAVKAKVVSADFKESFEREALNYGHTLGHAIEIFCKNQLRHGEAVAVAMVFVAELALARELIDQSTLDLHRQLLARFELPVSFERQAWQKLSPLLALDKKARGNNIRFVALRGLGATVRLEDLSSAELDAAYERISS